MPCGSRIWTGTGVDWPSVVSDAGRLTTGVADRAAKTKSETTTRRAMTTATSFFTTFQCSSQQPLCFPQSVAGIACVTSTFPGDCTMPFMCFLLSVLSLTRQANPNRSPCQRPHPLPSGPVPRFPQRFECPPPQSAAAKSLPAACVRYPAECPASAPRY